MLAATSEFGLVFPGMFRNHRARSIAHVRSLIRITSIAGVLITLAGCANQPQAQPEPALGISTPEVTLTTPSLKASEAVRKTPELTVTRAAWQFAEADGVLITTPNYRLYTTVDSATFLERLPVFYERALEHYTTALATLPKPTRKLESFLFLTRRQWQTKTREMLPDQADMFSNLGRGGFTTRGTSVLYYIDRYGYPRDTFAIAAHEGWHQYTQQTFKHQLPIWLEEGVATFMEGYRPDSDQLPEFNPTVNYERRQTLRDALWSDDLIPLEQVLSRTPQHFLSEGKELLLTYYAQVWALTRFLHEGESGRYRASLSQILVDAAEGRLVGRMASSPYYPRRRGVTSGKIGQAVVQEYFNPDLAQFEQAFLSYIEDLAQQRSDGRGRF